MVAAKKSSHKPAETLESAHAPEASSALRQGGRLAPKPKTGKSHTELSDGFTLIGHGKPAARTLTATAESLQNISKAELTRVDMSVMPKKIPDFHVPGASKDALIAEWLKTWIELGLASGKLKETHLLPRKADLAEHLGVSIGTVQNAIRFVEDEGYVESKQRIGTLIRRVDAEGLRMRKQTSKRDQAVVAVKALIVKQGYTEGQFLPSAREIAKMLGTAPNTTRLALEFLSSQGTLSSLGTRGNKANWKLQHIPEMAENEVVTDIESETLIDQLERELKEVIARRYKIGDKLPSHLELADEFKVSIKTIHDAMKRLSDQTILRSKRGRYGTFILRIPQVGQFYDPAQDNLFVPAADVDASAIQGSAHDDSFYNYEKVEQHLKTLIMQQYHVGDKLPSMGQLSSTLDVSSNTIRKALQNLADQGWVTFTRGRYGGTFVTQIPAGAPAADSKTADKPFTWVSINPETIKTYRANSKARKA